jgi:ubiquinone/menaquinone biosynthesis C-methylase UbiE
LGTGAFSSTERGYDLLAPKFDVTPFRTPSKVLAGLAKYLGEPRSIDAAIDLCCGTGAAIDLLLPLCRQRVAGIDFSQGMLDVARQRYLGTDGRPSVEFLRGDVLDMQFREEFDLAVTVGSLGHILPRDEPQIVERVYAALKPGGRFVFVTGYLPPMFSRQYILSRVQCRDASATQFTGRFLCTPHLLPVRRCSSVRDSMSSCMVTHFQTDSARCKSSWPLGHAPELSIARGRLARYAQTVNQFRWFVIAVGSLRCSVAGSPITHKIMRSNPGTRVPPRAFGSSAAGARSRQESPEWPGSRCRLCSRPRTRLRPRERLSGSVILLWMTGGPSHIDTGS